MIIYIVSHYYDNGESYEDYREFEKHELYSTYQKAKDKFWASVVDDYEGKFTLTEWELDTQEKEVLEESAWVDCKPYYSDDYFQHVLEDSCYDAEYDCYNYGEPDPCASIEDYWRWDKMTSYNSDDISEEEDTAWYEYVTTPGTNYQEWEAVNKEIEERKKQIELESLNEMLEELLTIK